MFPFHSLFMSHQFLSFIFSCLFLPLQLFLPLFHFQPFFFPSNIPCAPSSPTSFLPCHLLSLPLSPLPPVRPYLFACPPQVCPPRQVIIIMATRPGEGKATSLMTLFSTHARVISYQGRGQSSLIFSPLSPNYTLQVGYIYL